MGTDGTECVGLSLQEDARAFLAFTNTRWTGIETPGIHQWLQALLEAHAALAAALVPSLDPAAALARLRACQAAGDGGEAFAVEDLLALAASCVPDGRVGLRELACIILTQAGCALCGPDAESLSQSDCRTIFVSLTEPAAGEASAPSPTPLLDEIGVDLTAAARRGALAPVVGREDEIELVVETLCRSTKRNPALIGPAGVGKTALVEGLAQRIIAGKIPALLAQVRLIMLSITSLVAGCSLVGEFEERVSRLLAEARRPEIVLFFDEAHALLGAGTAGRQQGNDLANMLKCAMARGEIACVAATTDEEYRQYIEKDPALERRFQPVRVQELTPAQTREALRTLAARLAACRGVTVPDGLLDWMVRFADEHLRNRYFPDKAIDILEQCVAYALTHGHPAVTPEDADAVARRMVGMPGDLTARLAALRDALRTRSLLPPAVIDALVDRLALTMRGLDLRTARPNAVLLLLGPAAAQAALVSEIMAEHLFGAPERVVALELGHLHGTADLTHLLGAPPGYVGHGRRVPLHALQQTPWCVLRCDDVHACHHTVREVLAQGLRQGHITLADGKRAYLSDAVVLLTADVDALADAPIGFGPHESPAADSLRSQAADLLGDALLAPVDLLWADLCLTPEETRRWLHNGLLSELGARFRARGVRLSFDTTLLTWLISRQAGCADPADWERLIERELCPVILPHLPASPAGGVHLRLTITGDACVAVPCRE